MQMIIIHDISTVFSISLKDIMFLHLEGGGGEFHKVGINKAQKEDDGLSNCFTYFYSKFCPKLNSEIGIIYYIPIMFMKILYCIYYLQKKG